MIFHCYVSSPEGNPNHQTFRFRLFVLIHGASRSHWLHAIPGIDGRPHPPWQLPCLEPKPGSPASKRSKDWPFKANAPELRSSSVGRGWWFSAPPNIHRVSWRRDGSGILLRHGGVLFLKPRGDLYNFAYRSRIWVLKHLQFQIHLPEVFHGAKSNHRLCIVPTHTYPKVIKWT